MIIVFALFLLTLLVIYHLSARLQPAEPGGEWLRVGAVALTDQSNMFGAVRFPRAAMAAGVKPIFGARATCCVI